MVKEYKAALQRSEFCYSDHLNNLNGLQRLCQFKQIKYIILCLVKVVSFSQGTLCTVDLVLPVLVNSLHELGVSHLQHALQLLVMISVTLVLNDQLLNDGVEVMRVESFNL